MFKRKNIVRIGAVFFLGLAIFSFSRPFIAEAQIIPIGGAVAAALFSEIENDPNAKDCGPLGIFCTLQNFMNWFMRWVMALFLSVTGLLVALMTALIELLINMSRDVIGGNPLVQNGFRITLGIANLGFVLAIIIIAFATILRYEKYEMKKTLQRLIIAAVLVNFSLTIAGLFFDFTNVLAYFFINKIDAGTATAGGLPLTTQFGEQMAASLQIHDIIRIKDFGSPNTLGIKAVADLIADFYTNFVSLFLAVAFSVLILIVFGTLAFMLLVRYIYLTILIILMPIAWLCWVIPDLEGYWSKWWKKFLKYTFFLPTVMFFLYLAMLSSRGVDSVVSQQVQQQLTNPNGAAVAVDGSILQGGGITGILQLLVKLGLFVAALMVGSNLGIEGSKASYNFAKGLGTKFVGSRMGGFKEKVEDFLTKGKGQKVGVVPFLASNFASRVPGLQRVSRTISQPVGREIIKSQGARAINAQTDAEDKARRIATAGDIFDLRKAANQFVIPGVTSASKQQEILTARLALAKHEESGGQIITGDPTKGQDKIESIRLPHSESRRNKQAAEELKKRVDKAKNVIKQEAKEAKKKKEKEALHHLAEHMKHEGGHDEKDKEEDHDGGGSGSGGGHH